MSYEAKCHRLTKALADSQERVRELEAAPLHPLAVAHTALNRWLAKDPRARSAVVRASQSLPGGIWVELIDYQDQREVVGSVDSMSPGPAVQQALAMANPSISTVENDGNTGKTPE